MKQFKSASLRHREKLPRKGCLIHLGISVVRSPYKRNLQALNANYSFISQSTPHFVPFSQIFCLEC